MARFALLALVAASTLAAAAQSEARLVRQRTVGTSRVCVYAPLRALPRSPGSGDRLRERSVGLGEPCPYRYRAPETAEPAGIPPSARLDGTQHRADRTICRYSHLGLRYSRALAAGRTCPLTAGASD